MKGSLAIALFLVACGPSDHQTPGGVDAPSGSSSDGSGGGSDQQSFSVYAHSDTTLYVVDLMAKTLQLVGPFDAPGNDVITDLAVAPDNTIYVISNTAIYTASAAMDLVLEVGVERVRERTRYLADDLIRRIQERGWKLLCPTDSATRSSIVILGMEQPEELVSALAERGIIVDSRPGRLRISPHFYNSVKENEQIVTALDELLSKRGK